MKPILRYRSQLLYRRSYKPARVLRVRPGIARLSYRPARSNCRAKLNQDLMFLISF
jgi:hypothetical protein